MPGTKKHPTHHNHQIVCVRESTDAAETNEESGNADIEMQSKAVQATQF